MERDTHDVPAADSSRPMMFRHVVASAAHYDQRVWGESGAFHAQPRRLTLCGIQLGRLDDPDTPDAPPCVACAEAVGVAADPDWRTASQ